MKRFSKNRVANRLLTTLSVLKNGIPPHETTGVTYDQDGLTTIHNSDFMREADFVRAYQAGEDLDSWFGGKVHWRLHVLFWSVRRAMELDGDFVECGVHRGGFSKAIVEYVDFGRRPDKTFYLLDSFDGFAADLVSEKEKDNGILDYPYSSDYEFVVKTFSEYKNVVVVKGFIPDSLSKVNCEKVSFLSIDLNCAAPEIAAAEFFWDKLVSGASIVLDDYGWAKHIVQKQAFDEFALEKNVPILSLPTGQGLIIKP